MTTDPFTTAAGIEFKRRFQNMDAYRSDARQLDLFRAFRSGMQYAATQRPTDAERAEAAMDELGCELRVVENGSTTCDLHGGYATSDDVCEVVHMVLAASR